MGYIYLYKHSRRCVPNIRKAGERQKDKGRYTIFDYVFFSLIVEAGKE